MGNQLVESLPRLIEAAGESMAKSLSRYFPQRTKWDIQEANATLHFAHQLHESKFHAFPEARLSLKGQRADLLAMKPGRPPRIVLAEVKRVYTAKNARGVVDDIERWREGRWERKIDGECLADIALVMIVVSHKPSVLNWWKNPKPTVPFPRGRSGVHEQCWGELSRYITQASVRDVVEYPVDVDGAQKMTGLAYAIWPARALKTRPGLKMLPKR